MLHSPKNFCCSLQFWRAYAHAGKERKGSARKSFALLLNQNGLSSAGSSKHLPKFGEKCHHTALAESPTARIHLSPSSPVLLGLNSPSHQRFCRSGFLTREWEALRDEALERRCLLRIPSAALRRPWPVLFREPALLELSPLGRTPTPFVANESGRELSSVEADAFLDWLLPPTPCLLASSPVSRPSSLPGC